MTLTCLRARGLCPRKGGYAQVRMHGCMGTCAPIRISHVIYPGIALYITFVKRVKS